MSYIDLVRRMRPALLAVNARAVKMERQWSAQSRSPYGRAAAARENPPLERTRRRLALDPSRGPSISSFLHASPDRQFPRTQSNDTVVHKQRGIPFPGPRLSQPPSTQRDPHPRSEVAPYDFLYPEHPSQEHFPAPHKGSSRPSSRADHVHESGKRQPARSFSPFERTAPSHARFDPQRDREGPRTFPIHRPVNRPVGMDRPHGARSSPLAGQQGAADRRIPGCTLRAEGEPEANAGSGDVSRRNGRSALFASKPIVLDLVRDPDDTRGPGRARDR